MVAIPSGTYVKAENRGELRQRTKVKSMVMSKYLCLQELYEGVMGENPSRFRGYMRPVENISWCDAIVFCNRLSIKKGLQPCYLLPKPFCASNAWAQQVIWNRNANGYRLPTDTEWEYCARGGELYRYAGSDKLDEVGWYCENSGGIPHPVGQKKANGFGLFDMSGNLKEWCWDPWNPHSEEAGRKRVNRGGSWNDDMMRAECSYVSRFGAAFHNHVGFRFVRHI